MVVHEHGGQLNLIRAEMRLAVVLDNRRSHRPATTCPLRERQSVLDPAATVRLVAQLDPLRGADIYLEEKAPCRR